jgi:hypothetical protein
MIYITLIACVPQLINYDMHELRFYRQTSIKIIEYSVFKLDNVFTIAKIGDKKIIIDYYAFYYVHVLRFEP